MAMHTCKDACRAHARAQRAQTPQADAARADEAIAATILDLVATRRPSAVLTYLSYGSEVDTRAIVRALLERGITVAAPRCAPNRQLDWLLIDSLDQVEAGPLGIPQPAQGTTRFDEGCFLDALALVPGLLFDAMGQRLGQGGGYYDCFLERFEGCSVGLVREEQLVADLSTLGCVEAHDQRVDMVCTQERLLGSARS